MLQIYQQSGERRGGFALIIALSLMAFVLLLILSITTLVRVESQSSQTSIARIEAEQNAILGLHQALGELQRVAGPDSRVTVASELFDSTPDNITIQDVATRHYTGVFRAHDTSQPLKAFRATQNTPSAAIRWLASAENDIVDPVATAVTANSTEIVSIAKVYQADTNTLEDIVVGKVPVDDRASGAFAWWIGDEGMKAKFNIADADFGITDAQEPLDPRKLSLIQMRQSNFSHVSDDPSGGFDKSFSDLRNEESLSKLVNPISLGILSSKWGDWILPTDSAGAATSATVNPDVTFYSRGLPVDITQGRLKEDLTVYLETGKGLDDDDHIVRGSSQDGDYVGPDFGPQFTSDPESDNLPRFGLLRSWHDQGKALGEGESVDNQAQTNTQHGFHPTVMRAGVSFTVARVGEPVEDPNDPARMLVNFQPMAYVRVALLNPYNFTLPAEQYLFEISIPQRLFLRWKLRSESTGNPLTGDLHKPKNLQVAPLDSYVQLADFLSDGIIQPDNYTWQGDRAWLRMTVDTGHPLLGGSGGMLPGETLNYAPELSQRPLVDSVYVDRPADQYRAGGMVNYADPIEDELEGLENVWALPLAPVTVSMPKLDPYYWGNPLYTVSLRYQLDTPHNLEQSLSWRLSLLGGSEPILLSSKDPTKTTLPESFFSHDNGQAGFNTGTYGVSSFNLQGVKSFASANSAPAGALHTIEASMVDYWSAAARRGGARQGGDRRNAVRNPRGGILRADFDLSNWQAENHRISVYEEDSYEGFWEPARWQRSNLYAINAGTVEGFVLGPADNSTANLTGTRYTFYDFPRRFGPITSIGQLQHANLNPFGFGSAYQVGFSRAPYHVPRDALVETANTSLPNERIDLPYMLNASLWDRFYLSTIAQEGNLILDPLNVSVLANNRHVLAPDATGAFPNENALRDSDMAFEQSAAHIQVDGAFNINSVSVDAWEAVLLQAAGKTISTERDGELNTAGDDTFVAFPRFPDPVYGVAYDAAFDALDPQDAKQHAGLFVTDRGDIRILAEQIVAEIKRRGPFLSLADFVNRRLLPDADSLDLDYQGLMGTLDAAILRASQTTAVLNHQQIFGKTGDWNQQLDPLVIPNATADPDYAVDVESAYGVPEGHQSTALEGNAANLTQGDLLQALGSQLSARSDTFVIRTYGESTDPISGEVTASARCEAVVQRIAEPVDESDSIVEPSGSFGRRFVITTFRWLDEES